MSIALGRSLRHLRTWRSARPSPSVFSPRNHIFGLGNRPSFFQQLRSDKIQSELKRYVRKGQILCASARAESASPGLLDLNGSPAEAVSVSPWNIANAVTAGRIAITPCIGYSIISGQYNLALAGLVYAGVSDALDGFLARRLNITTVLGSYLDPAADKLLISTTTIALACKAIIPVELAALIIGRDVCLVGGWLLYVHGRKFRKDDKRELPLTQVEPLYVSKINTSLQIGLCFTGVVHAADLGFVSGDTLQMIGHATALTTTASGISYANKFREMRSG